MPPEPLPFDWTLTETDAGLTLQSLSNSPPLQKPFLVDFASSFIAKRIQSHSPKEAIAKAVGIKKGRAPRVLDATAGWGRDAFLLASYGCSVTLIERSSVVASLLQDGLRRAAETPVLKTIAERLLLQRGEAKEVLGSLSETEYPEVITLDPMFPEESLSSLVKKDMQILRFLVEEPLDAEELFAIAYPKATQRLVVKRSLKSPFLTPRKPTFQIVGKTIRYDVYETRSGLN